MNYQNFILYHSILVIIIIYAFILPIFNKDIIDLFFQIFNLSRVNLTIKNIKIFLFYFTIKLM